MIDRNKITKCPICGSENIEHKLGDHVSNLRGIAYDVPQTVCHQCCKIFLGPDSLEVIRKCELHPKLKVSDVTS